jgi:fibronectin-binding autotransporter adhesin
VGIDIIGTIAGSTGDETASVTIPLSAFASGTLDINSLAGDDTINIAGLTLASNQSLDIDGGDGTDTINVPNNPVVNGTFDTNLNDWTTSGNVSQGDAEANFSAGDQTPNGVLSQIVSVTAGVSRRLFFDMSLLSNGKPVAVRAEVLDSDGSMILATADVTKNSGESATTHTLDFTPTGSTATLRFTDITANTTGADLRLDNISLAAGATLSGSGSVNVAAEAVDVSAAITTAGNISVTADTVAVNDTLTGTGTLAFIPQTASTTIGLGGGSGTLNLDDTELGFLQDGFSSITIGDAAAGTGLVSIDGASFNDPVTIVGGSISGIGPDSNENNATLTARSSTISLTSIDIGGALATVLAVSGISLNGQLSTVTLTNSSGTVDVSETDGFELQASSLGSSTTTITLPAIGITGAVSGTGSLSIVPSNAASTIGIGGGTGTLSIGDTSLANLADGFCSITIGDAAAGTGAVDVDSSTFNDPITIVGGSIAVEGLAAGANAVALTARAGAITDGGGTTDVTGSSLAASATTGVGTGADALETVVTNFEASGGSGGVNVANTGGLTVGGASGSLTGVSATGGDITITASSPLTVNEAVVNSGGGNVTLTAAGTAAAGTGALTFVESLNDGVNGVDGLRNVRQLAISPDGKHVYAGAFLDDSVAVFSRDATTGVLTFVEVHKDNQGGVDGLNGVRGITVSPDGENVYVAAQDDDAVAVFTRDATTGELTFVEKETSNLNYANQVAVSDDGNFAYVTSVNNDSIVVFSRSATDGALTFFERLQNGVVPANGMDAPNGLVLSPDNSSVYVTSRTDDAVTVFSRDATTGALTFVEQTKNGVNGVNGLNGPFDVATSADGNFLYVTAIDGDAVTVFSRNSCRCPFFISFSAA